MAEYYVGGSTQHNRKFSYPKWHFVGEKRSMLQWLFDKISDIDYTSVCDLFGGSGIVSHSFRVQGKNVVYNDLLRHLFMINSSLLNLTRDYQFEIKKHEWIWKSPDILAPPLTEKYYSDYYSNLDLRWIDSFIHNYNQAKLTEMDRGLMLFALCQVALRKRPFNSFHKSYETFRGKNEKRSNSMNLTFDGILQEVFEDINQFCQQLPNSMSPVSCSNVDAIEYLMSTTAKSDLYYVDPPYLPTGPQGRQLGNYVSQYHVLEFLADYNEYIQWIDKESNNSKPTNSYPLLRRNKEWLDVQHIESQWNRLLNYLVDGTVVCSYRDTKYLPAEQLLSIFQRYFNDVELHTHPHVYNNLSKESKYHELLIVAINE